MHFDQALRYLLDLGHETLAIKLGLRNIELLLRRLGDPQKSYPAVQIAGTNGKGSTAVMLDSICAAAGIRSGLYTSPHLVSITERIRIGGDDISRDSFAAQATLVRNAAEALLAEKQIEALPTFFEQVTAIALAAFRDEKVDLGILETGLGGRLDATSAALAKIVGVTSIAMDHEQYLGQTLESIAAEKAAVVRPGTTAIIGSQAPEALKVILDTAESNDVTPSVNAGRVQIVDHNSGGQFRASFQTPEGEYENILLGLRGRHQLENASVAIRLAESLRTSGFEIAHAAIVAGLEKAKHAGRLELWEGRPGLLFDGAHNPAGAKVLREFLDEFITTPFTLVFGAMEDKKLEQMASVLFPAAARLILVEPDNPRAAKLEMLNSLAQRFAEPENIRTARGVEEAIMIAKRITPDNELICVTGSLYLIGETQSVLKQEQIRSTI